MNQKANRAWHDRRHYPRRTVLWEAQTEQAATARACQVHNISLTGARVAARDLAPGSRVSLLLNRTGAIPARVAWSGQGQAGLLFEMDPGTLRSLFGDIADALGLAPVVSAA